MRRLSARPRAEGPSFPVSSQGLSLSLSSSRQNKSPGAEPAAAARLRGWPPLPLRVSATAQGRKETASALSSWTVAGTGETAPPAKACPGDPVTGEKTLLPSPPSSLTSLQACCGVQLES